MNECAVCSELLPLSRFQRVELQLTEEVVYQTTNFVKQTFQLSPASTESALVLSCTMC